MNFKKNQLKSIYDTYTFGSMLVDNDAHLGIYLPCSFGSHPIHLTFSISTSSAGNLIVNNTLGSSDIDFLTRNESIFIVFVLNFGLK